MPYFNASSLLLTIDDDLATETITSISGMGHLNEVMGNGNLAVFSAVISIKYLYSK